MGSYSTTFFKIDFEATFWSCTKLWRDDSIRFFDFERDFSDFLDLDFFENFFEDFENLRFELNSRDLANLSLIGE